MTLIGATTENPAFEVNGALLSRVRVYALQALTPRSSRSCCGGPPATWPLARTRAPTGCGRRRAPLPVDDDALEFLAARSEGDARTALNALELARTRPRRSWARSA